MAARSLLPLCGLAWLTYHLPERPYFTFLQISPSKTLPTGHQLPPRDTSLRLSAAMPVHPTAFCPSPALDTSQRQSLASPLCPQWMKQSSMTLRTLTGCCWLLSAQQTLLWKTTAKAIPGCVKAFIPLETACCEDALSLDMENYGLMSHRRASSWGEGELTDPRSHSCQISYFYS